MFFNQEKEKRKQLAFAELGEDVKFFYKYYTETTIEFQEVLRFLKYEDARIQNFAHKIIVADPDKAERHNLKICFRDVLRNKVLEYFKRRNITIIDPERDNKKITRNEQLFERIN